jgi:hypothetical protein
MEHGPTGHGPTGHGSVVEDGWLHRALLGELTLARGFPRSTDELCTAVRDRATSPCGSGEVRRVLQVLSTRGDVARAQWPGPVFGDHPLYWVLPASPWACPIPRPRGSC